MVSCVGVPRNRGAYCRHAMHLHDAATLPKSQVRSIALLSAQAQPNPHLHDAVALVPPPSQLHPAQGRPSC